MIRETDITLPLFGDSHPATIDLTVTWVEGQSDTILLRCIRPRNTAASQNVCIQDASIDDRDQIRRLVREAEVKRRSQIEFCKQPTGCDSTVISIKALDELRAVALQLGVDNAKLRSTMEKIREILT